MTDETVEELKAIPGVTAVSPGTILTGKLTRPKKGYLSIVGIDPAAMEELEFYCLPRQAPYSGGPLRHCSRIAGHQ